MNTHTGKVGRLPEVIREQLNRRLADGEPAGTLLEWLNALPEVRAVMAAQFGGKPINEPNLCQWRARGFQRWQQRRVRRTVLEEISEDLGELEAKPKEEEPGAEASKHFSRVLTADFAAAVREALDEETEPMERCKRIQGFLRTLTHLRREEYQAARLKIALARRDREAAQEERDEALRREDELLLRQIQGQHAEELFAKPDFNDQVRAVGAAEESLRGADTEAGD